MSPNNRTKSSPVVLSTIEPLAPSSTSIYYSSSIQVSVYKKDHAEPEPCTRLLSLVVLPFAFSAHPPFTAVAGIL